MINGRAAGDSGPYEMCVGADVLIRPESLSHGFAVPAPFHKGACPLSQLR